MVNPALLTAQLPLKRGDDFLNRFFLLYTGPLRGGSGGYSAPGPGVAGSPAGPGGDPYLWDDEKKGHHLF